MKKQLIPVAALLLLITGCATTDDAESSAGKNFENVSFETLHKHATDGKANAQGALAMRYLRGIGVEKDEAKACLLYTSPSPRDLSTSRMPSSA